MTEQVGVTRKTVNAYTMSGAGRDMMYALYSTFLIVFLTDALGLSNWQLVAIGTIIAVARVWDAVNDPIMGAIIDNTKSKYGKFKPWILIGALSSAVVFFLLFQDLGLSGTAFVAVFGILYVISGMTFTMNDIAYWSMYPSFTTDPSEREKIGSRARIFASLGMFITIASVPLIYQNFSGGPVRAFSIIALIICSIYVLSQVAVFFLVKQPKNLIIDANQRKTTLLDMVKIIFKNDQLVVIIVAILLFNIGYFITTSLGIYFFNYDFNKYGGAEFTIFSGILAVSQLTALGLFPVLMKKMTRKQLFTLAVGMITVGYLLFMSVGYLLPMNMLFIGLAGLVLFSGQGFIQVLVLVMLADTIEYGQWKLGTRNESVVFAINPFVTKLATAVQTFVVTITLAASGLNSGVIQPLTQAKRDNPNLTTEQARALIASNVSPEMLIGLRLSMIIIPLLLILLSYVIYRWKYKIDAKFYQQITSDLTDRIMSGDL
ncbi:MAG: sugar transporter [Tenericutes bacterium HGW-Tenericutes-2]|jgi:melibiose permease/lactose/raffinose/galactose permease|nr:MAG: sugar transporter [Tenericutes bacterium HGW-Tenericutes-2]